MIKDRIRNIGIIPVVSISDSELAVPLANALLKGGLNIVEITFRTESAYDSIKKIREKYPQMMICAGTVLTIEQVNKAIEAGANFIVTPGFNKKIVEYCLDMKIMIIPGCSTPTEIEQAIELGLDIVKFFPAEASGGVNKIKALSAPYTQMTFMPTGGINENNLLDYLSIDKVVACGGSFMCTNDMIIQKQWEIIENNTNNCIQKLVNIKFDHIEINAEDEKNKTLIIQLLKDLFFASKIVRNDHTSIIEQIKIVHVEDYKKNGCIVLSTPNINRAIYYLEKKGFSFDFTSLDDSKDNKDSIYLKEEILGFEIKLLET